MTFKEKPLVELCEIVSSKRVFAASYQSEGVPFYRGKEVSQLARGEMTTAELYISNEVYNDVISRTGPINSGDILLTAVGTLGNPYQVKETDLPFYFKDGNIVWLRKFSKEINSTYLFYWLNSKYGRRKVLDTAIGSTQAALTITGLAAISISCPSLAKQTGIVGILSAIDQKITINNSLSKTLEDIAQTIFKSWFIDFDPVKAKMAGEKPEGMDAATAALFPDSMVDSELGLIPKGWHFGILDDVIEIYDSKRIPISGAERRKRPGKYPYYGATGVLDFIDNFIFEGPHVLVGEDGTVITESGTPLVQYVWDKFWVSNHTHVLKGKQGFSVEQLKLLIERIQISNYITGAVQPKLNQGNLKSIPCVIPNVEVSAAFGLIIEPFFRNIRRLTDEKNVLIQLRESLLPRLISGELQIPEEMLAS